jgi:predicted RND superfamily exporter protein
VNAPTEELASPGAVYPRAERFVAWLERNLGTVLIASLVVVLASSSSLLRLRLDMDLLSMLPSGRPRFADYQRYVQRFAGQDLIAALIRAPDATSAIAFADAFTQALAADPEIRAVRSRVDLTAFSDALRDGALPRLLPVGAYPEVERRLDKQGIEQAVETLRRVLATPGSVGTGAILARDPLGLTRILAEALSAERPDRAFGLGEEYLISPDGTRLVVLIRPADPGYDIEAVERLTRVFAQAEARAREAVGIEQDQRSAPISVGYMGAFAYARSDAAGLRSDMILFMGLALVGVLAVFYAGYRNLRILPFVTYHMLLTTLLTFALGLLVYGKLNAVSLSFAAIFYGLSIDTAIHFYTRFLEERRGDVSVQQALARTIGTMFPPSVVAATTTAAAFVTIGLSELAGIAQLGMLTAVGMLLNVAATFVLLPALMLWRWRRTGEVEVSEPFPRATLLARLASCVARRRKSVLAAEAGIVALSALVAAHAELDTNLFHLRPKGSPAALVQAEIEAHFGLSDPDGHVIAATVAPNDPVQDDDVLRVTEAVDRRLMAARKEGLVSTIVSPAPLLPSLATQKERLAAWAKLPRARAARDLTAALSAAGFNLAPFAPALTALERIPEPVDATLTPLPGLELLFDRHVRRDASGTAVLTSFAPRDAATLEAIADELPRQIDTPSGVRLTVTGRPLMERELERTMRFEIVLFLALTLISNAVLIWLRERAVSVTLALLVVPAGVVVLVVALGELLGIPITPVNLVVLPLTIGIGVDNCVYLVERYRETGCVGEATARGGRAVTISAATTLVGFGVLGLSRYPGLAGLGWLAAASMALCFLGAIVVLPALLTPADLRVRIAPRGAAQRAG